MVYEYNELPVTTEVTVTDEYVPLTGVFATEVDMGGFLWDRRRGESQFDDSTRYRTAIGGYSDGLRDATLDADWQSGSLTGLSYESLAHKDWFDSITWTPQVQTGTYAIHWDGPRRLYSDYSAQGVFDPTDDQNGVNTFVLRGDARWESVSVALYKRQDDSTITRIRNPQFVTEFTGQISSGSRLETVDGGGNVIWANLETRKQEFIIDSGTVYLNDDYSLEVGLVGEDFNTLDKSIIEKSSEAKGRGSEEGRNLFCNYFPINDDSVQLISVKEGVKEWYSASFDGTDEWVEGPAPGIGWRDRPFSLSLWVKPASLTDEDPFFTQTRGKGTGHPGWWVGYYNPSGEDALQFLMKGGIGRIFGFRTPSGVLSVGSWTHIVCAYDGSNSSVAGTSHKVWIDGVEQTITETIGTDPTLFEDEINADPYAIGADAPGGSVVDNFAEGDFVQACVWENTMVTDSDVSDIYGAGDPTDPTSWSTPPTHAWIGDPRDDFSDGGTIVDIMGVTDATARNTESSDQTFLSGEDPVTVWQQVSSLNFALPGEYKFIVDEDLGIVTTSGLKAPNLTLAEDINNAVTTITCLVDDETFQEYPDQGIIQIGSEQIKYDHKGRHSFEDCARGYNTTSAAAHSKGDVVENVRRGSGTTDKLYLAYKAMPRIEYETTSHNLRTANKGRWLDIAPVRNIDTNNILQIRSSDLALDSLVLETDAESLGGNLYGPVFYGTSVARLTTRALDPKDNPLEEIDITTAKLSGNGKLNGIGDEVIATSNTRGETYSFFQSSYDPDNIEINVSNVAVAAGDTTLTLDQELPKGLSLTDIYVFQILKHSESVGSSGVDIGTVTTSTSSLPYGEVLAQTDSNKTVPEPVGDYVGGLLIFRHDTGGGVFTTYQREITWIENTEDSSDNPISKIYIEPHIDPVTVDGDQCFVLRSDAVEWNPAVKNGSRHIMYQWDNNVEHPVDGSSGAYAPIHPDSYSGNSLVYEGMELASPAPEDITSNLGGYVVMAPSVATLQARARDPVSGNLVRSNKIKLLLKLPSFLTGVDRTGALPVPHGFTFKSEEFNIGTGLGGANFITINPVADGINSFNIVGTMNL